MPVRPAMRNWKEKRDAKQHRRLENECLPPHMVPSQLKILIPVGTAMTMVVSAKNVLP